MLKSYSRSPTSLLLNINKNQMHNLSIISFNDISLVVRKIHRSTLLFLPFPLLPPPSFPLAARSLLPTPTQDNHPEARFSIKSVRLFHSHRAICGIMHTNHYTTKLFFNRPVRKITLQAHTVYNPHTLCTQWKLWDKDR